MSITEQSTELTVVDRRTGEILDVRNESDERLARFHVEADELKGEIGDMQAVVNAELVHRLDCNANWTMRIGNPAELQYEVKAPSPTAGTESYPDSDLEREVRGLVAAGVISEQAAGKALKRTITVEVEVPLDVDLEDVVDVLNAAVETEIAGTPVRIAKATASRKVSMSGINALRKAPDCGEALDRALTVLPAGPRKATVKIKTRES